MIKLVVFDWAGTTVDHGCFAPVAAFIRAFARHGIDLTPGQARGPMGLAKKDHVRALTWLPEVRDQWRRVHGRDCTEADVEALYRRFVPLQEETVADFSRLVPGLLSCVARLRAEGVRVGTTTGYCRSVAERVWAAAREQGYEPDHNVCSDDVPAGRPAPWMIFRNLEALGVYPPAAVVKVGDTAPDVEEGRNAGAWAVGVTRTGTEVGCTEEGFADLPERERQERLAAARRKLRAAGAHWVIESVAELPDLLPQIARQARFGGTL